MRRLEKQIARPRLGLRPITDGDLDFLRELYASTRDDIRQSGFSAELIQLLINLQFNSQHSHYQEYYPHASFDLIELDGRPVGRMYVNEADYEIRLIDITLLPSARNQGIATMLLSEWIENAKALEPSRPLRLRVDPNSPARRLYEKLGFELIADEHLNWHMQWKPELPANFSAVTSPSKVFFPNFQNH